MTAPRTRASRLLPWVVAAALLASAWGLNALTLPDDAELAPFVTAAAVGEPAAARNLEVTVTDVRAARSVTDADGWQSGGAWVVVDLDAAAVVAQDGTTLRLAELVIGARTFRATDRGSTFLGEPLVPGLARSGTLAFELPAEALTGTATLRLGAPSAARDDGALDGIIELTIDLDDLPVQAETTIAESGWAR